MSYGLVSIRWHIARRLPRFGSVIRKLNSAKGTRTSLIKNSPLQIFLNYKRKNDKILKLILMLEYSERFMANEFLRLYDIKVVYYENITRCSTSAIKCGIEGTCMCGSLYENIVFKNMFVFI